MVIPVRDEERSVEKLLESISGQSRLPDELLFVDAGSKDRTREIIKQYENRRIKPEVIPLGPAYPGSARNTGASKAKHDLIAFTDGGIELDSDWLKNLSQKMGSGQYEVIYGNFKPRTDTFFKECLAMAVVPPPRYRDGQKMRSNFIASSLMKKSVLEKAGGFPDFRAAEDRIFMEKIESAGFNIGYCPDAMVVWDIPGDIGSAWRRFYNYSFHDLRADRARDWHVPVMKMYAFGLLLAFLGIIASPVFFAILIAGLSARILSKLTVNSREPYFTLKKAPAYFLFTGLLILVIDLAMFAGWIRYASAGKAAGDGKG